jgi:hypothetical protein
MPEFDVEAFITQIEAMGMRLTALPMADGKLRVYRWRLMAAFEHSQQIEALWKSKIGDDQARVDVLAGAPAPAPMGQLQRGSQQGARAR